MQPKVIRSRSKREIGDIIEENWCITEVRVIAPPSRGNPPWEAPKLGIYDYVVEHRSNHKKVVESNPRDDDTSTPPPPMMTFRRIKG